MEDTYKSFEGLTARELRKLIKTKGRKGDLNCTQNDSPTAKEMLALSKKYINILYSGYVIGKPREDWRVSVEGFSIPDVSAEEAVALLLEFDNADEKTAEKCDVEPDGDLVYYMRFWWD